MLCINTIDIVKREYDKMGDVSSWLILCVCVHRIHSRICLGGSISDVCIKSCQEDHCENPENTLQEAETATSSKEAHLLLLRLVSATW